MFAWWSQADNAALEMPRAMGLSVKMPMLGKIEDKRRRGWQRMRWLESITDPMDMNLSKLREIVETSHT